MANEKSSNPRGRQDRVERERARLYTARVRMHDTVVRRRRRDNLVWSIAGSAVILCAFAAQAAYYGFGPGMPEPSPSVTETPTQQPAPLVTPAPTPAETGEETPPPAE